MLALIFALAFGSSSHAILTEPTYQAAEALGYVVVGEIEFKRGSHSAKAPQLNEQVREIGELCPRTLARTQGVSSFVKLVLLAWADVEFPTRRKFAHSSDQQMLAAKRAEDVAEKLRSHVQGPLAFELVNMTTRRPHPIRVNESARVQQETYDVKSALEIAGGAPSDAYGLGLFGENGQRSKVIIWVDCKETFGPRRRNVLANVQLASLGANFFGRAGN
jgi:hypothetical protein